MENSRKKELTIFKLYSIVSSTMNSHAWQVNHIFVQWIHVVYTTCLMVIRWILY